MAAQGGGESGGRSGLVPVVARCYLLLRVATCCCALVPVVARCYLLLRVAEARELVRCLIDA